MDKKQAETFARNHGIILNLAVKLKNFTTGEMLQETKKLVKEGIIEKPLSRPTVINHLEVMANEKKWVPRVHRRGKGQYSSVATPSEDIPEELKQLLEKPGKVRRDYDIEQSTHANISVGKAPFVGTYIGGPLGDLIFSHFVRFALFYYAVLKNPENPEIDRFEDGEIPDEVWEKIGIANNFILIGGVFNGSKISEWAKTSNGRKFIKKAMKDVPKSYLKEFEPLRSGVGFAGGAEEALDTIYY